MPKRKAPLPAPIHEWVDGPKQIGEIMLEMANSLTEERNSHSHAGDANQLAISALRHRQSIMVDQVNKAFAEQAAYQRRQANAGAVNKRVNGNPTASIVKQIVHDLTSKGMKVTAPAVEAEWRKPINRKRGFGQPVTQQAIRGYLRKLKTKGT